MVENEQSKSWLMTNGFAQLGFSTSCYINNEFGLFLLVISGFFIIIFEKIRRVGHDKGKIQYYED